MHILLSLFSFLVVSFGLMAQSTVRTAQVSAQEFVELKTIEATYTVELFTKRDQLKAYMREEYNNDWDDEGDYYVELDQAGISEEEYQEKMREHYENIEREKEEKRSKFEPFADKDLMALLDKNKLSYTSEVGLSPHRYDYEDSEKMTTTIFVKLKSSKEYEQMVKLLLDQPVRFVLTGVEYESPEKYLETIIPILTVKARKEADILARSLDKSLGDIIECTSDMPIKRVSGSSFGYHRDGYNRELDSNPFGMKQAQNIQYTYQFELLPK